MPVRFETLSNDFTQGGGNAPKGGQDNGHNYSIINLCRRCIGCLFNNQPRTVRKIKSLD